MRSFRRTLLAGFAVATLLGGAGAAVAARAASAARPARAASLVTSRMIFVLPSVVGRSLGHPARGVPSCLNSGFPA